MMKYLLPLLFCISLPAAAHVSLVEPSAPANSYYRMTLKIGHGCGKSPTHTVIVNLPEGIYNAKPMPKAGWELKNTVGKLAKPYDNHGKTITEDVRTITWSGGNLPNEFYDEFVISVKLGSETGLKAIPVTQLCTEGRLDWNEVAKEGEKEPKSPAPTLMITPAKAEGHHHGAATPASSSSDSEQIAQLLKAQWDKPDTPLAVEILEIQSDTAVAGWAQGEKGGRAFLRKHYDAWQLVACAGEQIKQVDFLHSLGVSKTQAQSLVDKMTATESKLPAQLVGQYDSFKEVVMLQNGKHQH